MAVHTVEVGVGPTPKGRAGEPFESVALHAEQGVRGKLLSSSASALQVDVAEFSSDVMADQP